MTEATARTVANALLGAFAVGAAWLILRNPRTRRIALQAARTGLTTVLPAYLAREVQQAWVASRR